MALIEETPRALAPTIARRAARGVLLPLALTSGENLFVDLLVIAPSSQELGRPANPGRVQASTATIVRLASGWSAARASMRVRNRSNLQAERGDASITVGTNYARARIPPRAPDIARWRW